MADIISFNHFDTSRIRAQRKQKSKQDDFDIVYPSRKLYQKLLSDKSVPIDECPLYGYKNDEKPNGYNDSGFAERASLILDEYDNTVIRVLESVREGCIPNIQFRMQRSDVAHFLVSEENICVEYIGRDEAEQKTYRIGVFSDCSGISLCRRCDAAKDQGDVLETLVRPEGKPERWQEDKTSAEIEKLLKENGIEAELLNGFMEAAKLPDFMIGSDQFKKVLKESIPLYHLWYILNGRAKFEFAPDPENYNEFNVCLVPRDLRCRGNKVRVTQESGQTVYLVYTYFSKADDMYLHDLRRNRWDDEWEAHEKERELKCFEHIACRTVYEEQIIGYLADLWDNRFSDGHISFRFPLSMEKFVCSKDPYDGWEMKTVPCPEIAKTNGKKEVTLEDMNEMRKVRDKDRQKGIEEMGLLREFFER